MKRRLLVCVVTMIIMCFASMTGWCLDKALAPHVVVLNEVYDELNLDKAEMENVIKYLDGLTISDPKSLALKTKDIYNDGKIIKFKADFVVFYKNKPKPTNDNGLPAIDNLYSNLESYNGSKQTPGVTSSPSPTNNPHSQKQSSDNAYVFLISLFVLILLIFLMFYMIIFAKDLHRRLNLMGNAQKYSVKEPESQYLVSGIKKEVEKIQLAIKDVMQKLENQEKQLSSISNSYLRNPNQVIEPEQQEPYVQKVSMPTWDSAERIFNECIFKGEDPASRGFRPCSLDVNGRYITLNYNGARAMFYSYTESERCKLFPASEIKNNNTSIYYSPYFTLAGIGETTFTVKRAAELVAVGNSNMFEKIKDGDISKY